MNFLTEIWMAVTLEWFDVVFEVSSCGNVRKIVDGFHYKETPQNLSGNGYLFVQLYHKGRTKVIVTHRLMALAFIPNPLNKPILNHKNLNKHDNRVDNLEWCTQKENIRHFLDNRTTSLSTPARKIAMQKVAARRKKPIIQLTKEGAFIKEYPSLTECAEDNNFSSGCVASVCQGRAKTYKGFKFKYKVNPINNAKNLQS